MSILKKIFIILVILIPIGFIMNYYAYEYNIFRIKNILMIGKSYNIDTKGQQTSNNLINLKFQIDKDVLLKDKTLFEFFDNNNNKIFEVTIRKTANYDDASDEYPENGKYHYHLGDEYVKHKRKNDSYMKIFCEDFKQECALTFAISDYEPIYKIPHDITSVKVDGVNTKFKTILFDYHDKSVDLNNNNLYYEYKKDHVKMCADFDSFKFVESFRITTTKNQQLPQQKVCIKESMNTNCCELKANTQDFSTINVLYWKGDWNKGYFKEYSIQLK